MVRWFPWSKGPNYEKELPRLAEEIQKYRTNLITVKATHRRWRAFFLLIELATYLFIVSYYFLVVTKPYLNAWQYVHVVSGPVLIYLLYTTLSRGLFWRETRIHSALERLIARRKELVDAFKKQINYDHIKKLIDEPQPTLGSNAGKSAGNTTSTPTAGVGQKSTPHSQPTPAGRRPEKSGSRNFTARDSSPNGAKLNSATPNSNLQGPVALTEAHSATPLPVGGGIDPVPVYQTSWVDRVLDLIIGENEQGPNSRYALICSHCHVHNGLAPFGKSADEVYYLCPVCHKANGTEVTEKDHPVDNESPAKENETETETENENVQPENVNKKETEVSAKSPEESTSTTRLDTTSVRKRNV